MSQPPPATPRAPQDDSSAAAWAWPPTEEDLAAIATLDRRAAVVVVCPPAGHRDLQWPPSEADLASVVAVSLDDDGVRRLAASLTTRVAAPPVRRSRRRLVPIAAAATGALSLGAFVWHGGVGVEAPPELPRHVVERPLARHVPDLRDRRGAGVPTPAALTHPAVEKEAAGEEEAASPRRPQTPPLAPTPASFNASPVLTAAAPPPIDALREPRATEPMGVTAPSPPALSPVATSVDAGAFAGGVPVALAPPAARSVPAVAVAPPPALPRTNEEPMIRALLEEYGEAYSRLDARAARAVWPAVDVQALTRAFDALESQAIDFERCDVRIDGAAARAACRGTSTWVPRVGERRPRRDAREWTFRLERAADAQWRIQSASMR